jgi:hypothetical protein
MPLTKITRGALDTNIINQDKIDDNAVGLAEMASGTAGNIVTYDESGNPAAVSTGSDGQVLTSAGSGQPAAMEDAPTTDISGKANIASPIFTGTPVTPIIKLTPTATASAPTGTEGCLYYDSDKGALMEYDAEWLKVSRTIWSSTEWTYTGAVQSWDVPAGVGTLVFTMWGAGGGGGKTGGMYGGAGGFTTGTVNISTSSSITLKIIVGGGGSRGTGSGNGGSTYGGAGGGYSGVFLTSHTHGNAILIAGGGGGGVQSNAGGSGAGGSGIVVIRYAIS